MALRCGVSASVLLAAGLVLSFPVAAAAGQGTARRLVGAYLGQRPPGRTPVPFAPGVMTAPQGYHAPVVFSPDMREAVWRPMGERELLFSRLEAGGWSAPAPLRIGAGTNVLDPFFAPDGRRLFFLSFVRDAPGEAERERMMSAERTSRGWAAPRLVAGLEAYTTHWTFSATQRGDLYFTGETGLGTGRRGIVVARRVGERYGVPQPLGLAVNATGTEQCPFVSPDERYLIFVRGNSSSPTKTDIYVSFRNADGTWTAGIDLGRPVNSPAHDLAPYVTPDGKYLLFISQRDRMNAMHWVDAGVIAALQKSATP